uniref:NADH-ubiquinone oxidoreductase chain 5 n=1 Tax=Coleolaelaps cf. liui XFX-2019 TaxID=2695870 RepID=A0A6B9WD99_9ACAR|nr:NADH dehydrogenase subunit 5 [Coleolaelaps cf. liui XFX-2019]
MKNYMVYGFGLLIVALLELVGLIYMMGSGKIWIIEVVMSGMKFMVQDMSVYFLIDSMSVMFLFVVSFISGCVLVYSSSYMEGDKFSGKFLILVFMFVLSMKLMILSPNMIMILLGWDGLGLVSYCLVIYYNNESSSSAGMITVMTNRLGDVGMLMSVVFFLIYGSWVYEEMCSEKSFMIILMLLVMVGGFTKSAQMPFSAWLPAAMAAPTPVSALVHSSTLVTAGVYLLIRLSMMYSSEEVSTMMMFMSVVTMFMSGLGALYEMDMKKVIALSTLSQLGVMMMVLGAGMPVLSFFHLVNHALFKAMLFLCAGVAIHSSMNNQDMRSMSNVFLMSPSVSMSMIISSLSLSGFPFLSGFYSKDMILEIMYEFNNSLLVTVMIFLSTMFTVMYSFRMIYYLLVKSDSSCSGYFNEGVMSNVVIFMSMVVVWFGSVAGWLMFPSPSYAFMELKVKLISVMLVVMGALMYIVSLKLESVYKGKEMSKFFSSMWYLSDLTSGVLYKNFFWMKNMSKNSEVWVEGVSGSGVKRTMMSAMKVWFRKFMGSLMKIVMMLVLLLVMM